MGETATEGPDTRTGFVLAGALGVVGLLARVIPLFPTSRLMQQFPTEDGYMMLTVARNIALGLGMSTSGGELPTNGVQPLATYLYAAGYYLVGGGRTAGVAVALVMQLLMGIGTAWLLYVLGRRACGDDRRGRMTSAIAAMLWFAGSQQVGNSMNCLESGIYALFVVWATLVWWDGTRAQPWSVGRCVAAGVLLGGVFWARNDGVFFILSACLWYVYAGRGEGIPGMRTRFQRTLIFGSTSVVVAAPWMIANYLRFDHIMPISGQSESMTAKFGSNTPYVPSAVWEALVPVLPVPESVELSPAVIAVTSLLLVGAVAATLRALPKMDPALQGLVAHTLLYSGCLAGFYGLYFGASHFMGRYMSPASPLLVLLLTMGGARLLEDPRIGGRRALLAIAATGIVVVTIGLHVRAYRNALPHQHWAVVNWVRENLSEDTWVGAIQTGTLGYFHDNTLNLDGKVNALALRAREGGSAGFYKYVVSEKRIDYMVDWYGLRDLHDNRPKLREHFDMIVTDRDNNVTVLKRRTPVAPAPQ